MADVRRVSVRTLHPDYVVEAEAVQIGCDILVYVWGGERPHIGAVAAAQSRPSLADPGKTSATASVLTFLGHKEDLLVKTVAEALSARLATNVVVTAGIHWDHLSPEGIGVIMERCREITDLLATALQSKDRA
jgi:gallate decarboxylase subunit D